MERSTEKSHGDWFDRAIWFLLTKLLLPLAIIYVLVRGLLLLYGPSDHGLTLQDYVENTSKASYEVYAEFDQLGIKFFEDTQYDENQVSHDTSASDLAQLLSLGRVTRVHNHPGDDAPFSYTDLRNLVIDKPQQALVISPNYVYSLEAPNGWPDSFVTTSWLYLYCELDPEQSCADGLITITNLSDDGTFSYESTNLLLERFAEDFDLTYRITPLSEWLQS